MLLWGHHVINGIVFVAMVALMSWGGGGATVTGLLFVVVFAAAISLVVGFVYRRDHVPACTAIFVLIAAYFPRAWQALEKGFAFPIKASGEAVAWALLALIVFMAIAVSVAHLVAPRLTVPAAIIEYVATGGRPAIGAISIGLLVLVSTIAGFRTGMWSHYGDLVKTDPGGIRMELLYFPLLFGFSVAIGRMALKELIGTEIDLKRAIPTSLIWTLTIVLLFIAQSRRAMLGALILTLVSAWLETTRVALLRTVFVTAGLAVLAIGLAVGSYLWRHAGPATDALEQIKVISDRSVDIEEFSQNFSDRLTYLWIDSASIEHYQILQSDADLYDVANSNIIRATPEIILPEKYATKRVVCENAFAVMGIRTDLPCTPTAEGIIYGGIPGLFITAISYGIGLGIITALYRRSTFSGLALGGTAMYQHVLIECSAFPIIDSMRVLVISIFVAGTVAWVLRFFDIMWTAKKNETRSG